MVPAEVKSFEACKVQAEKGDVRAQTKLGMMYYDGKGIAPSRTEALKWWRKAAENGDAEAQCHVGFCHSDGRGVVKDEVEAIKWFRKSAEQGYAEAQYWMGSCYDEGLGVAKDAAEAVKWFRKAADQGDATSQFSLGCSFMVKDPAYAVGWFRKAAQQGYTMAQLQMGDCYADGFGVRKDKVEAYAYYNLAGLKSKDSRSKLAVIERTMSLDEKAKGQRRTGELEREITIKTGATPSVDETVIWLIESAGQGNAGAQVLLGSRYRDGDGVAKNAIEAYAYFNIAAVTNESARKRLEKLEEKLTDEERLMGQKRSKELQKEIEAKEAAKKAGK